MPYKLMVHKLWPFTGHLDHNNHSPKISWTVHQNKSNSHNWSQVHHHHFTNSKTKLSAGPDPCITTDPVHQKTHDNVKVHAATVPGTKMSPDHQTLIPNCNHSSRHQKSKISQLETVHICMWRGIAQVEDVYLSTVQVRYRQNEFSILQNILWQNNTISLLPEILVTLRFDKKLLEEW